MAVAGYNAIIQKNIKGIKMRKELIVLLASVAFVIAGCSGCGYNEGLMDPDASIYSVTFQQGLNGYNGTADACVSSTTPDGFWGADMHLRVDKTSADDMFWSLLKFDLSYLMPGTVVRSAYLTLYTDTGALPMDIDVWRVGSGWNENSITFMTVPSDNPVKFTSFQLNDTVPVTIQLPLQMVQEWVNNQNINYGILLSKAGDPSADYARFHSADTNDKQYAPKLVVRYEQY
jgi:hypothetical protein